VISTADNLIVLLLITIGLGVWPVVCVYIGFRLGRYTEGRPMAPIINHLVEPAIIEDPYDEPMYGKPQKRIPTIPGEES